MTDLDSKVQDLIDNVDISELSDFKLSVDAGALMQQQAASTQMKPPVVVEESTPESFTKDFDYVRANIKDLIENGQESLYRLLVVAATAESPRAFEVVAKMMDSINGLNKSLLEVHKAKSDSPSAVQTTNVQNNTVFVGSTAELSKLLRNKSTNTPETNTIDV